MSDALQVPAGWKRLFAVGLISLWFSGCGSSSEADVEAEVRDVAEQWAEAYGTGDGETACSPSLVTADFIEHWDGESCPESLESFASLTPLPDEVPIEDAEIEEVKILGQMDSAAVYLERGPWDPYTISLELVDGEWLVRSF